MDADQEVMLERVSEKVFCQEPQSQEQTHRMIRTCGRRGAGVSRSRE